MMTNCTRMWGKPQEHLWRSFLFPFCGCFDDRQVAPVACPTTPDAHLTMLSKIELKESTSEGVTAYRYGATCSSILHISQLLRVLS